MACMVHGNALGSDALGVRLPWENPSEKEWAQETIRPIASVLSNRPAKNFYKRVPGKGPYIAFTFDDGPRPWTKEVLDALKERNLKATFFVIGRDAARYAKLVKRMVEEGHEVANHSLTHENSYLHRAPHHVVEKEVRLAHHAILKITGVAPKVFRPPGGNFTEEQSQWIYDTFGYANINWSVDPGDRRSAKPSPAVFQRRVMSQVHDGAIILSHDLWKSTIAAIPATLDALLAKGYQFLTVSELLALDDPYEAVRMTLEDLEVLTKGQ